jgi:hypothetical protein
MSAVNFKKFIKKWMLDLPDHTAYVEEIIQEYGQEQLDRLKARFLPGAPVNYGGTGKNMWSEREESYSPWLNLTRDEYLKFMKDNLELFPIENKEAK